MQPLDKITAYTNMVCDQIRWKKAHPRIAEEMGNHIIDQRDSYILQGLDEDTATEKAIAETGDAVIIGAQLDRTHRPKPQWAMLAATMTLLFISFVIRLFVFNDEERSGLLSVWFIYTALGVASMLIAYFSDFTIIGKYSKTVYFFVVLLSVAVLIFSPKLNGRSFYTQYITLLFPLAFAAVIFATRNKRYLGIILCGAAFSIPACIASTVPTMSGLLLFAVAGITLLCIAISKNWFGVKRLYGFLLIFAPIIFLTFVFVLNMNNYRWNRLAIVFNPSLEPNGAGYLGTLTRELLSGARLFGMGDVADELRVSLSESINLFKTDLLLTTSTVLLGWIAFVIIICALLLFIVKGFMLCFKQKSGLGLFVSSAIMLTFTIQVISYVGFNLGFQFTSPLSLPLISHGNTAMIINMVLIGIMLSVFRTGDIVKDSKAVCINNKFLLWDNGKLTINFKK